MFASINCKHKTTLIVVTQFQVLQKLSSFIDYANFTERMSNLSWHWRRTFALILLHDYRIQKSSKENNTDCEDVHSVRFDMVLWSWSADKLAVHSVSSGFHILTILNVRAYKTCNSARLELYTILVLHFDPKWIAQ
jgi:hypothetical protein